MTSPCSLGTLRLIHTSKTMKIVYDADENASELTLPVLCPGGPNLDRLVRAGTAIKTFEVGKEDNIWGCRAEAQLSLYDVAPPLDRLLSRDEPETVDGSTKITFPKASPGHHPEGIFPLPGIGGGSHPRLSHPGPPKGHQRQFARRGLGRVPPAGTWGRAHGIQRPGVVPEKKAMLDRDPVRHRTCRPNSTI